MVRVSSEETSGGRDKRELRFGNQSEHEIVEDSHIVSSGMFFETSMVFMETRIAWVMKVVLNLPVGAQHIQ